MGVPLTVNEFITQTTKQRPLHVSLIDPDFSKNGPDVIATFAAAVTNAGSDVVFVGGSSGVDERSTDIAIQTIKRHFHGPVILFPGNTNGLSRSADALLFMSLLNSRDLLWVRDKQVAAAPIVKRLGIETLPTAYLIVEPGMKAGEVGKAEALQRDDPATAVSYALAAQYLGMQYVYLEAGSGAPEAVPSQLITAVKQATNVVLIVGGGIRTPEAARTAVRAGADMIVTGTIIEHNSGKLASIVAAVHGGRGNHA